MPDTLVNKAYGFTTVPSSPSRVVVTVRSAVTLTPSMGMGAYFDVNLQDGYTYRAFSTVSDVETVNNSFGDPLVQAVAADDNSMMAGLGKDIRHITLQIEAVWRRSTANESERWKQFGGALPTSPATSSDVFLISSDIVAEVLDVKLDECVFVGTYRDATNTPLPMMVPGFNGSRGATHQAIIGRSGSGKTAFAHTLFLSQMRNEGHGIVVIDPQGQWSSERGFLFSLQKAARALGRQVHVLRVSEDIRLPRNAELLGFMMDEMDLWKSLTRMGEENSKAFSAEVAKIVMSALESEEEDGDARDILFEGLKTIANSDSIRGRIYARSGDAGDSFKKLLCYITEQPYYNNKGDEEVPSVEDAEDATRSFDSVLENFTPIVNLFMKKNLLGNRRRALGGEHGFLSEVLKVRQSSEAAPYVILDMSADTTNSAIANYARSVGQGGGQANVARMREVLDNTEIKAHIVSSVLSMVVRRAEDVFNNHNTTLDTQIVFDEAWRYAPRNESVKSAIGKLSKKLAGWALDTRKYGIGWTYILQSPNDLHETIWQQLTYLHVGHGIIGNSRHMLDGVVSDSKKLSIYDQFADPSSTGVYPFMSIGPNDPLRFTATPTFFNVFSNNSELLAANKEWMDRICDTRGLPRFTNNNTINVDNRPTARPVPPTVAPVTQEVSEPTPTHKEHAGPEKQKEPNPSPEVGKHEGDTSKKFGNRTVEPPF